MKIKATVRLEVSMIVREDISTEDLGNIVAFELDLQSGICEKLFNNYHSLEVDNSSLTRR